MATAFFGQGYPGGLNLPSGLRFRADIGIDGELVDISDDLNRFKTVLERTSDPGASTLTCEFLADVGGQYDIYDINQIFVDSDDPSELGDAWPVGWPYSDGTWWRFFMGTTVKPDSTSLAPGERQLTLQCVDNTWWEKYPPMNAGLPYPPGGTAFINTVSTSGISPGSHVVITPFRMKNIYAGIDLFFAAPISGTYVERVHVESVNYTGQLVISHQILAAGTATVPVSSTAGITVGQPYHVYNISDGTHFETIYPISVNPGVSFTAAFVNSHKTGDWVLMAGSFTAEEITYSFPAYSTTVSSAITEFGSKQTIHPLDISFIEPGMAVTLSNADHTYPEVVDVLAVDTGAGTFDAIVAWPKSGTWHVEAFPSVIGGPSDKTLLAGEWLQDVDNQLTTIAGIFYAFYDDSQSTKVVAAYPTPGIYDINPTDMTNIFPGRELLLTDDDPTHRERVTVGSVTPGTFRVILTKPKNSLWNVFNGPWVDKTRIDEVQPLVALTSNVSYTNTGVQYQGRTVASLLQEIEQNPTNIDTQAASGVASGTDVRIAPYNMFGIKANKRVFIENGDGSNAEEVLIKTVDRTGFTVDLTSSKAAGFHIFGRVTPRHYWSHTPGTTDEAAPWFPQPRYYDAEVRGKLALRVLTDNTVVDPVSGTQFGEFTVKRDGSNHYNAVQVLGQNGSWARFVDWADVSGSHGLRGTKRVYEGPPVSRSDVYTNDQAYEVAASIVASHNFCLETPTITAYGLVDPDLFSEVESITLIKSDEPSYANGATLPVNRVRLSFDEDGVAKLEYELGSLVPEGIAHAIAGFSANAQTYAHLLGPPVHQTQLVTRSQNLNRSATAYYVDASLATADNQRTVVPPSPKDQPTFYATVHKVDDSEKPVIIKAPDRSMIDGRSEVSINNGGGPYFIYSDGTGYRTIQGFSNPHDIDIVYGDPIAWTSHIINPFTGQKKVMFYIFYSEGDHSLRIIAPELPADGSFQIANLSGSFIMDALGIWLEDMLSLQVPNSIPTANYTAGFDTLIPFDCTSGDLTLTLPQLSTMRQGLVYATWRTDVSANTLTVAAHSGDTIDGAPSLTLAAGAFCFLVRMNTEWKSFGGGVATSTPRRFKLVWNFDASAVTSNGAKWQLPFNCTVVAATIANDQNAPVTVTPHIRRSPDALYPGSWDASPLDDGNLALTPGIFIKRTSPSDFTGWTTSLQKNDWLRVEVATADATAVDMVLSLELEEAP